MTKTERATRRRILKDDRYHAALHEAAHAVTAIALGQSFICLRLCSESAAYKDGRKAIGTRMGQMVVDTTEIIHGYEAIRDDGICILAGVAFEKRMYPRASWIMLYFMDAASNDFITALNQAEIFRIDAEAYMMKEWYPVAVKLVRDHWGDIIKIGSALYDAGELSYAECVKHVKVGARVSRRT